MANNKAITFNRFYVQEFLDAARLKIGSVLPEVQAELVGQLIDNLKAEDDITNGIERLAREQGTGELSIFLFDIFDRIEDYPPTVAYDALQDIVEDFVNALSVMMEEERITEAMKIVNADFTGEAIAPELSPEPETVVQTEETIFNEITEPEEEIQGGEIIEAEETVTEEITEHQDITAGIVTEPEEQPAGKEIIRESISFEIFVTREVESMLQTHFADPGSPVESKLLFEFSDLVLGIPDLPPSDEIPRTMLRLMQVRQMLYPWRYELDTRATKIMDNLSENVRKFADLIKQFAAENEDLLHASLQNGKLTLQVPKYIREEVPEEPMTIDRLLSEYFKSEVEEHIQKIRDTMKDLTEDPENHTGMKDLIGHFQSLNEISMIHGYTPVESFCSHILDILNFGLKEHMIIASGGSGLFEKLFQLLGSVEQLRDARAETKEAVALSSLADKMAAELMEPKPKNAKQKSEKPKTEKKPKPEPPQKTEPAAAEKEVVAEIPAEPEISLSDSETVYGILKEILQKMTAVVEGHATTNPQKVVNLFETLAKSAGFTGKSEVRTALEEFRDFVQRISGSAIEDQPQNTKFLTDQYGKFAKALDSGKKIVLVIDALRSFKVAADLIKGTDTQKLLEIMGGLERKNQKNFSETIGQIADGDVTTREYQTRHFNRLAENLSLTGSTNYIAFPRFFMKIFENRDLIARLENSIVKELEQSYKLFIDSLSAGSTGLDTAELVSVLEEMIAVPEKESVPSEEATPEPAVPEGAPALQEGEPGAEEGEEDLNEIFRQESENSFSQIRKALDTLDKDPNNTGQYGTIERNLHSLKSSARLMGYSEVADIAAPLEDLCETIHSGNYKTSEETQNLIREGVAILEKIVAGESPDTKVLKEKLTGLHLSEEPAEDLKKSEISPDEKPLFAGSVDDDTDLLDIFKDESDQYIKILEQANKKLYSNLNDKKALKELETASHSLKSAAKMLGFREVGQLGDILEMAAEAMHKGEIQNSAEAQQQISRSIDFIKKLTTGEKADADTFSEIVDALQPEKLKSYSGMESTGGNQAEDDRTTFLTEAEELLEKINSDLVKIEKKPEDPALLNNLYRNMHTLKGGAQIMQYNLIGSLAHRIEDFFEAVRQGSKVINSDSLDPVYKAVDEIQILTQSIRNDGSETSDQVDAILKEIGDIPAVDSKTRKKPVIRQMEDKKGAHIETGEEQTIKLSTQRLDHLMNMAAGLIINKTQLSNYLESMKTIVTRIDKDRNRLRSTRNTIDTLIELNESRGPEAEGKMPLQGLNQAAEEFNEVLTTLDGVSSDFYSITQHLEQNIREISQLTKQLHDDILQARMVPSEFLFNRFPRAVRDLARKQKKKINLMVEGEHTELDRVMIETLTDPLMHLIRNAIDHGIETPKERKEKGKSEDGIILLKALRDKNQIIIEIQDDGRGIDPDMISEKAVKLGLVNKSQIKKMRREEILDLIFASGFSTTEKATDVSGRGVGLDVVATQIQKLNGDIRLSSTPDKGTIFRIRVPLTLAITQAMLVELDDEILAIQISTIDEAIEIDLKNIVTENDLTYLKIRDQKLPVKNLANFLHYEEREQNPDRPSGLIIHDGNMRYVLQVDAVLRREEIVVKNLGPELKEIPYISGGTVLGDGSIVLILDVTAVTHKLENEYSGDGKDFTSLETARKVLSDKGQKGASGKQAGETKKKKTARTIKQKKISDRKPVALIVDDSLSVRKFVSAVLERNNYTTVLASDGPEAFEKIQGSEFDIIITDLEMPRMQGLDLIGKVREDDRFKDIPIIILTGKSGREHEEKGKKAGANAYIIKPFKEGDLLKTLEKFILV